MPTTTKPWFVLPDKPVSCEPVVVLGAGLAGCHTAYELAERNIKVLLVDGNNHIAGGASANPAGIVKPYLTRSPCLSNDFSAAAFAFLLNRLENNPSLQVQSQFKACGVLQLIERSYTNDQAYRTCTPTQASDIAGLSIDKDAIFFPRGGYLNSQALCSAMIQHPNIDVQLNSFVKRIEHNNAQWTLTIEVPSARLSAANDEKLTSKTLNCNSLVLANGEHLNRFKQTQLLPVTAARGQTSQFKTDSANQLRTVVTGKHYAIPMNNHVHAGATFTRDDDSKKLQEIDHNANRSGLSTLLPELRSEQKATSGFCGIRATTPDRLPLVGPVPNFIAYQQDYKLIKNGLPDKKFKAATYQSNLYVIGGFGSRGIVSAPYCAMLLAEQLCKNTTSATRPETLARWSTLLHPGRFAIRALKRNHALIYSDV